MAKYSYPIDFESTFWTIIDGDYYVSTVGNDITGDGSPKKPFLTIAKAFEFALDGEKVVIGPDEYIDGDATGSGPGGAEVPCRLASTANVNLSIGGMFTIDGNMTSAGDRILVWNQTNPAENGIYIASPGPWQRAEDFNDPKNIINGKLIPILQGAQYGKSIFQHTTVGTITLGSTALVFERSAVADWGSIQGDINSQTDLTGKISTDITVAIDNLKGGVPAEGDTLNKLYNLIQGVVGVSASATDIADRDAKKATLEDQQNIYVTDASADTTVNSGWAIYKYLQPTDSFAKIMEQESLDVNLDQFWNIIGTTTLSGDTVINTNGNALNIGANGGSNPLEGRLVIGQNIANIASAASVTSKVAVHGTQVSSDNPHFFSALISGSLRKEIKALLTSDGILVTDSLSNKGLEYAANYSANYSDRTLVDKGYVDSKVAVVKVMFESDLDNVQEVRFSGPITVQAPDLYHGISIVTYEVAVDGASPVFTPQANVTVLQSWIDTNITAGTKWILRLITNASKSSQVDFKYAQV